MRIARKFELQCDGNARFLQPKGSPTQRAATVLNVKAVVVFLSGKEK